MIGKVIFSLLIHPDMKFLTLDSFDLRGKRVFVRLDINSPIGNNGEILDDSRIRASLPTLRDLADSKVVIIAHQGRVGKKDFTSLENHADLLAKHLGKEVKFTGGLLDKNTLKEIENLGDGEIMMLENIRFYAEETSLKEDKMDRSYIVKKLLPYVDYYVNDAFSAAHRAQLSLIAFAKHRPMLAGRLMEKELKGLGKFLSMEERPKIMILGGAKIEDSIKVARNMLENGIVDYILTGGVVANVFLKALGKDIGKANEEFLSKEYEEIEDLLKIAGDLVEKYRDRILVPEDVVINENFQPKIVDVSSLNNYGEFPIWDIGPKTIERYTEVIMEAKGIGINGPMGVYEKEGFEDGTKKIFEAIANSQAYSVAGGGHTINALNKFNLFDKISHISMAGGALITYLSGGRMPVIEALEESYKKFGGE